MMDNSKGQYFQVVAILKLVTQLVEEVFYVLLVVNFANLKIHHEQLLTILRVVVVIELLNLYQCMLRRRKDIQSVIQIYLII